MGRMDYKNGRFSPDYETNAIDEALRGYQTEWGDTVVYCRFWREQTQVHDVYDEATGGGRIYHAFQELMVQHATHVENARQTREEGSYYNDDLYVVCSFDQLTKAGLSELDLQTTTYLNDRVIYDERVFDVTRISVTGQMNRRDIMVSIEGTQVKPDEMLNDPQFQKYIQMRGA